jgi:hypothetical protein
MLLADGTIASAGDALGAAGLGIANAAVGGTLVEQVTHAVISWLARGRRRCWRRLPLPGNLPSPHLY